MLSVLVNSPIKIETVDEILYSDCFYDDDYRFLFDTVMEIYNTGQQITQSAIINKVVASVRKDILATYQMMKKYYTSDTLLWQNSMLLSDLAIKRALLNSSLQMQALVKANDPIEKFETLANAIADITNTRNRPIVGNTISDSINEMEFLMDRKLVKGLSGIDTGVADINSVTSGWQIDDTVVIAGRPGMGKTLVAVCHAYGAAAAGVPVAIISLEMAKAKLTSRIYSNLFSIPSSDITKGKLSENEKRIVREKRKVVEKLPIYYYDYGESSDINDISLTMRAWKRKYGIGLIIIDYIQLMTDREVKFSVDDTKVVTSVQKKLTRLKGTLKVPIIELAQLSRNLDDRKDKRPILSDLKNSSQIEQDATIVVFLYRQDYYDELTCEAAGTSFVPTNKLEYILAKNREGGLGPISLKADMALNRLYSGYGKPGF
ncbi:DnaB-like helicase C-terminal domain-containing protein [Dyadobacter sp. CY345]|uniref:replicative DNA helicase n=1 Tax=Dyadobacter sp. CY345 TaxID=2909335 RepID=UPI001F36DD1A|nr:DnaB-like helicase C-terminal domain-containing protein [Dyadobacter sp. CY345]MCF2443638.1 DnaB-like helicase C-terminal domain-containing protein [Dyadobacter sp. CY345]